MINDEKKEMIIHDTVIKILKIEKDALNQLSKPQKSKIVDDIITKFEEEYTKNENKQDSNS